MRTWEALPVRQHDGSPRAPGIVVLLDLVDLGLGIPFITTLGALVVLGEVHLYRIQQTWEWLFGKRCEEDLALTEYELDLIQIIDINAEC